MHDISANVSLNATNFKGSYEIKSLFYIASICSPVFWIVFIVENNYLLLMD